MWWAFRSIFFQIRQPAACHVSYRANMMNLRKFDILQEFVIVNIGVLSLFSLLADQLQSYAVVVAGKQNALSLLERVIQNEVPFIPFRNGAR